MPDFEANLGANDLESKEDKDLISQEIEEEFSSFSNWDTAPYISDLDVLHKKGIEVLAKPQRTIDEETGDFLSNPDSASDNSTTEVKDNPSEVIINKSSNPQANKSYQVIDLSTKPGLPSRPEVRRDFPFPTQTIDLTQFKPPHTSEKKVKNLPKNPTDIGIDNIRPLAHLDINYLHNSLPKHLYQKLLDFKMYSFSPYEIGVDFSKRPLPFLIALVNSEDIAQDVQLSAAKLLQDIAIFFENKNIPLPKLSKPTIEWGPVPDNHAESSTKAGERYRAINELGIMITKQIDEVVKQHSLDSHTWRTVLYEFCINAFQTDNARLLKKATAVLTKTAREVLAKRNQIPLNHDVVKELTTLRDKVKQI